MRQYKFCPGKQQYNNAKPFPVYVLANEEVENYYECSKCGARTWNMNLMFLHQNDSFVLLGKVYLKIGMHMNILYCNKLTTSEDLVSNSVFIVT